MICKEDFIEIYSPVLLYGNNLEAVRDRLLENKYRLKLNDYQLIDGEPVPREIVQIFVAIYSLYLRFGTDIDAAYGAIALGFIPDED